MERNIDLKEISDGRLYDLNDLVKADCNDCTGCSACCQGMGSSIVLDPFDIYRLSNGLNETFEQLLNHAIELNVVDGLILPNLKMGGSNEQCNFLNEQGRCSVHSFRPGICRIFPLGRFYENRSFRYFLQVHECAKENKSKVKVHKWIDTPNIKENEQFIKDWHYFLKDLESFIKNTANENLIKTLTIYVLNQFYRKPFSSEQDFYEQFKVRLAEAKSTLGME